MQNQTAQYQYRVHDSITQIDPQEWRRFIGPEDLAMDQALIDLTQRSLAGQAKFWTVVFKDLQSRWVACACLSLFKVDMAQSLPLFMRKFVFRIRNFSPHAFQYNVLFCGLPLLPGHSHLRLAPNIHPKPILMLLNRIMRYLAKQENAFLIVLKEFDIEQRKQFDFLNELNFYCAPLSPLFKLTSYFDNFEEYLRALRSNYRHQICKNMKKFSDYRLKVEHIFDAKEINNRFSPEVYQLYLNTWSQAKEKLECMTLQFFQELPLVLPSQVVLTLISQESKTIAFAISLLVSENYYNLYIGIDYNIKNETDLYFNLFYHELTNAFHLKRRYIYLGQTSDDFKMRLGALPEARFFYVRPLHPIIRFIFVFFHPLVFPKLKNEKKKNVFK